MGSQKAGVRARFTTLSSRIFRSVKNRVRRLQIEGAEGDALRGDVQRAVESEFSRAAAEGFFSANTRNIRRVVLLGEMREDKMLRSRIK